MISGIFIVLAFIVGLCLGALLMAIFTILYFFGGMPTKQESDELKAFILAQREALRERQVMH